VGGRSGWLVVAACCVLALLCGCTGALPDPSASLGQPTAAPTAVVADAQPAVVDGPSVPVSGRVRTSGGLPVAGAIVALRQADGSRCGRCGRQTATRSDATGAFALIVPEGAYLLSCTTTDAGVCRLTRGARLRGGRLVVAGPMAGLRLHALPARRAHAR
jgi:hypothetical protein